MKLRRRPPNKAQRGALTLLKQKLGEAGFFIFPAPCWLRESKLDFLALKKPGSPPLLSVQPQQNGTILLRLYEGVIIPQEPEEVVRRVRNITPVSIMWGATLPRGRAGGEPWGSFFTSQAEAEMIAHNVLCRT